MNPFNWIRNAAKNAFLAGIADGVAQLKTDVDALPVNPGLVLEGYLLPAPVDLPTDDTLAPTTNGRRRKVAADH